MNNNDDIKTTEEVNTSSKNDKNNSSFFFDAEDNPLHKAVIEGITGVSNIYLKKANKAVFEIIRGWYPDISLKEMLVCWQAFWTMFDHRFPLYDEITARLEKSRVESITEALRKEFHVHEVNADDNGSRLFSSEWDVKRPISQARRKAI